MYNLTREQAAEILQISTRTLDRRVRKWILSHEKKANKVYLSEEEVRNYKQHKEVSDVVLDSSIKTHNTNNVNIEHITEKLEKHLDDNLGKFFEVLKEKDTKLEEKNKIIFALQQRLWEVESKIKNMVALPLYQKEKEEIILEKEHLKTENKLLEEKIKKEKIINIFLTGLIVLIIILIIFLFGK